MNYYLLLGASFISYMMGGLVQVVGTTPESCEPYEWFFPLAGLILFSALFLCGYMAGQYSKKTLKGGEI
jgi:hypothetical protein